MNVYAALTESIMMSTQPKRAPPAPPILDPPRYILSVGPDGFDSKLPPLLEPPHRTYAPGNSVRTVWQGANPRNWFPKVDTFLSVERFICSSEEALDDDGSVDIAASAACWERVYDDGDYCTRFFWGYHSIVSYYSNATIDWDIPLDTVEGIYRIQYFGARLQRNRSIVKFSYASPFFHVRSTF